MRFESIHNYYESMVVREIINRFADKIKDIDEDFLEDVACIALNMLPSRYVRHDVDMAFFLTTSERDKMTIMVNNAVSEAITQAEQYKTEEERPNTFEHE